MKIDPLKNHRILVIDDNRAIHEDIRKILKTSSSLRDDLDHDEAALFGDTTVKFRLPILEIDSSKLRLQDLKIYLKSALLR